MLETRTGDVTVHCSCTLHRAHPPVDRPRKVVYTSFRLPPLAGDATVLGYTKRDRAELTSVQDRIAAADNPRSEQRYSPAQSGSSTVPPKKASSSGR
jgi:hypothetical protein